MTRKSKFEHEKEKVKKEQEIDVIVRKSPTVHSTGFSMAAYTNYAVREWAERELNHPNKGGDYRDIIQDIVFLSNGISQLRAEILLFLQKDNLLANLDFQNNGRLDGREHYPFMLNPQISLENKLAQLNEKLSWLIDKTNQIRWNHKAKGLILGAATILFVALFVTSICLTAGASIPVLAAMLAFLHISAGAAIGIGATGSTFSLLTWYKLSKNQYFKTEGHTKTFFKTSQEY